MIRFVRIEEFRRGQDDPVRVIEWEIKNRDECESVADALYGLLGPGRRVE